jgi:hypothetical protein
MATAPAESKMHRLRVGDVVTFQDNSEWPPVHLEGPITEFANVELTYLTIDFGDAGVKTLTEDEVTRVA